MTLDHRESEKIESNLFSVVNCVHVFPICIYVLEADLDQVLLSQPCS